MTVASVIPREGVESDFDATGKDASMVTQVIPREGVESAGEKFCYLRVE